MTSLLKRNAVNQNVFPTVQFVGGPYFVGDHAQKFLFPFTFVNGTLDIDPINGFNTSVGTSQPLGINGGSGFQVRQLGGQNLVQDIGDTFRTYIKNCNWSQDNDNNPDYNVRSKGSIKVYLPGIVTRVQQLSNTNLPQYSNPNKSFVVSSTPPVEGFVLDNPSYGSTYVFEKPLVVQIDTVGQGRNYITFFSSWDN